MPQIFSWGIFALFLWLVPHVSIEIGEYRRSIYRSPFWTVYGGGDKGGTSERFQGALQIVRHSALVSIAGSLVLISGTAAGVAVTTQGLDPNMFNIIEGGSLLLAAVLMAMLSIKSPKWIGVYCSSKRVLFRPVGKNARVLGFNVWWSVSRQFAKAYFCLLPFFCGAGAALIMLSAITGILAGLLMDLGIYLGRHKVNENRGGWKRTYGMAFLLVVLSSSLLANGCYYIDTVWGYYKYDGWHWALRLISGSVWFIACALVHFFIWRRTSRLLEEAPAQEKHIPDKHARWTMDRMVTSLVRSAFFNMEEQRASVAAEEAAEAAGVGISSVIGISNGLSIIVEEKDPPPAVDGHPAVEGHPAETEERDQFDNDMKIVDPSPIDRIGITDSMPEAGNGVDVVGQLHRAGAGKDYPFLQETDPDPSWCSLVASKFCCHRSSSDQTETATCEKIGKVLMVIFWMCISGGFIFFVIINIGAQAQVASTNNLLPGVEAELYTDMDLGEVCAIIDDDEIGPQSDISTFPSREDAHASGYRVLHCGACGYCSTWENLRLEWSTRNYLAAESARCAKKSLGGGREAVLACMQKEPLSFDFHCADCWTTDILCTRDHCAFIYLQSQLINKVGNFKVAPGEVTSATCEEAHCEVDPSPGEMGFVRCSGATRRRMNIKSTIARPTKQQCTIVDVTWEDLFGPCCANTDEFYVDKEERARGGEKL